MIYFYSGRFKDTSGERMVENFTEVGSVAPNRIHPASLLALACNLLTLLHPRQTTISFEKPTKNKNQTNKEKKKYISIDTHLRMDRHRFITKSY